ncbi:minor capsid protein [Candidatus Bathyarchaeota archaeon]|nr:minor capsid protein [Candidatus Bathyarchaeota archaeon]
MGLIDWFTGKKPPDKQNTILTTSNSEFTAIGNTEPLCPYCNYRLDKMPLKKKQCPNCKNFIRSRTRPLDNKKVLIKEEQVDELERQWAIKNEQSGFIKLGSSPEERQKYNQGLATQIEGNKGDYDGLSHDSSTKIRRIIADGILKEKKFGEISREIVRQVDGVGIERASALVSYGTMKALNDSAKARYDNAGVKYTWLAALDGKVCKQCASYGGKIVPEETDGKMPPLHEGCRCTIIPLIEIPQMDGD